MCIYYFSDIRKTRHDPQIPMDMETVLLLLLGLEGALLPLSDWKKCRLTRPFTFENMTAFTFH